MPPQGVYSQPGYSAAQVAKRKSPVAAALLGFFLGGFGAQAFYNGQVKKGFAQLVMFWIVWLFLLPQPQYIGDTAPVTLRLFFGLVIAGVCAWDGYKVAEKINAGQPVKEFGSF